MIDLISFVITFIVVCFIAGIVIGLLNIIIEVTTGILEEALEIKTIRKIAVYLLIPAGIGIVTWYIIALPSEARVPMIIVFAVLLLIFAIAARRN